MVNILRQNHLIMEKYSDTIIQSLKVFFLLKDDIRNSINILDEDKNPVVQRLAFKSLYIDLHSFIDELNHFDSILKTESFDTYKNVNEFLILSHQGKKLLHKNKDSINKLRNTIFAHNYRDLSKEKKFIDPSLLIVDNYKNTPVLVDELKFLGEVAILIGSLAVECFQFNSEIALAEIKNPYEYLDKFYPLIEYGKSKFQKLTIEEFVKEIYLLRDALNSHQDNYDIISRKIKCKIRV